MQFSRFHSPRHQKNPFFCWLIPCAFPHKIIHSTIKWHFSITFTLPLLYIELWCLFFSHFYWHCCCNPIEYFDIFITFCCCNPQTQWRYKKKSFHENVLMTKSSMNVSHRIRPFSFTQIAFIPMKLLLRYVFERATNFHRRQGRQKMPVETRRSRLGKE